MKSRKKIQRYFIRGPIGAKYAEDLISSCQSETRIGAYCIFLGQVRADKKVNSEKSKSREKVSKINYSAYEEMAVKEIEKLKQGAIRKFGLTDVHILHSLGDVNSGQISVLVMVISSHRGKCFEALKFIVNEIKNKVPIWKKEIYNDGSFRWVK